MILQETIETTANRFGEVIEPDPVPFTFDAPGWIVLFAIILMVALVLIVRSIQRYRANKFRRDAIALLDSRIEALRDRSRQLVYEANVLMKKLAMRGSGRSRSASLIGSEWSDYLNTTARKNLFNSEDVLIVEKAIYGNEEPLSSSQVEDFLIKVKTWIKVHNPEVK